MSTINPSRVKPEDEELAKKRVELAQLESELADRELYIATLNAELAAFERQYLKIVGTRYAELDEINAQIAEQLARQGSDNVQFKEAAQKARMHAEESRSAAEAHVSEDQPRILPSKELKSLYREVAKRVHPDLSTDPEDRKLRQRLMAEANRVYERGDLDGLKRILDEYESCPEAVLGEGVGAELVRVIRKITQVKRRLSEIEAEVKQLIGSDLAKLKAKAEEYGKLGRDLLAEMAQQVERDIAAARERLRTVST
jgi:CII-binding regulator of phage lambda lysogenization HflD